MTKETDALRAQLEQLTALLDAHGIRPAPVATKTTERADYIEHGSDKHATFLGLVESGEDDETIALAKYTSPRTGRTWRMEDEISAMRHYPGIDPEKAVALVLQQKVNELENAPGVPKDAPPMFRPAAIYP